MGKARPPKTSPAQTRPTRSSPTQINSTKKSPAKAIPTAKPPSDDLRRRVLADLGTLRVPLDEQRFDEQLSRAEQEGLAPLEFLARVVGEQANRRRERAIERRIRDARFPDICTLADFDWQFNAATIDRGQIEQLAACDFLRRRENLVMVGQSGLGKSRIIKSIARQACAMGYTVRYTTSAALFSDLTAALADQTLSQRVRYYGRFDLLVIDEFGFDRIERDPSAQAASLLYKIIDARGPQRSTALVTNIDFDAWSDYLGDPPLAMAALDRLVDGAIILKLTGESYRAHRSKQLSALPPPTSKPSRKN
jgi:DNA replication protein DnaC